MNDDCRADDDHVSTLDAEAILHCLKFLAQEAASLRLTQTLSAIEGALETAAWEGGTAAERHQAPYLSAVLH